MRDGMNEQRVMHLLGALDVATTALFEAIGYRGKMVEVRPATVLALGEAMGLLDRAKTLIGEELGRREVGGTPEEYDQRVLRFTVAQMRDMLLQARFSEVPANLAHARTEISQALQQECMRQALMARAAPPEVEGAG